MPLAFQLGYLCLNTGDFVRTKAHYVDVIGLRDTGAAPADSAFLSTGFNAHDIVLTDRKGPKLDTVGLQLAPTELADFARAAREYGFSPEMKSDLFPDIAQLVEFTAHDGLRYQFFTERSGQAPGFRAAGVSPLRLGHFAVVSEEAEKAIAFYKDFLGFYITDSIGGEENFLTCNYEHHVVNIVRAAPKGLHHIAFELRSSEHQAMAADVLSQFGVKTEWGPSRHTAGHNIASYHYAPDGALIEFYNDMDIYLPELNMMSPRAWHHELPMRPRVWNPQDFSNWKTDFTFNFDWVKD